MYQWCVTTLLPLPFSLLMQPTTVALRTTSRHCSPFHGAVDDVPPLHPRPQLLDALDKPEALPSRPG